MRNPALLLGLVLVSTTSLACLTPADGGGGGGGGGGADGGSGDVDGGGGTTDGGGGGGCSTGTATGDPIVADALTWTWVDFPEARCMNDTATGIGVSINPDSTRVLIYLQGGGACFDGLTCNNVANRNGFGRAQFDGLGGGLASGPFDRQNADNAFASWSHVFVPYCSGDVHAGTVDVGYDGNVQRGYLNMSAFLERLGPTFPEATQVVISGSSAGGFGAAWNFMQTQEAFGTCTRVDLLDDAGPPLSDTYLKPCLQKQWRDLWGLDASLPSDCAACFGADGGGLVNMLPYVAQTYPDNRFALMSTTGDQTIRFFFGYGYSANCDFIAPFPEADFRAGLLEVRDTVLAGEENFGMFLKTGTEHTFLFGNTSQVVVNGTALSDWIWDFADGAPDWTHVGP